MRPVATKEAVFQAADALRDAGDEPSSRAVREAVGGGSLATIQRHLRAWRAQDAQGATGPAAPQAAPDAIADRLDALTQALIGMRLDLAEKDDQAMLTAIAALRADLAAQAAPEFDVARVIAGLRADLADAPAGEGAPGVTAALEEMRRDIRALNAAIRPLMEEIRRLSAERDRLHFALTTAEKRLGDR